MRLEISIFKKITWMYFEVSSKLKMSKIFILSFSSQIWSAKFFTGFSFWQPSSRQCRHAATQYSPFFYMYNSLSKEFLKKVCICNVQTWANQLVQRRFLYIRDDATNYGGPSPTLKDQRGLLPETSNPLLVDILNKSCWAAFSEGGSDSILISSFVAVISMYLEYLIIPSDSSRIV